MTDFELHERLAADCLVLGDLGLSRLLLMNDSQYPWLILVPRRSSIREVYELPPAERAMLWSEIERVGEQLMAHFGGDKLNIGALGNMVPQLHVHLIVRFDGDPAWPGPVWGANPAKVYAESALEQTVADLRALFFSE